MSIKFINEPVIEIDEHGNKVPFIPVSITNGRQAYAASLNIIFKHIAEFHITILNIIAEKHGLNVDEILEEVHKDDRYIKMSGVIDNMGAFPLDEENPAPTISEPLAEATVPASVHAHLPIPDMFEPAPVVPAPAKKIIRKRKTKTDADDTDKIVESMTQLKLENPEDVPIQEQKEPEKKKRVYKKKATAEA